MYLFGGSNLEMENIEFFALDLKSFKWEILKCSGNVPITRDEHTAVVYGDAMYVFGGYVNGSRTDELYKFTFRDQKWECLICGGKPIPRAGHSASITGSKMHIFGGKDDDNNKLNDLWEYDITKNAWVELKGTGEPPIGRSGQS